MPSSLALRRLSGVALVLLLSCGVSTRAHAAGVWEAHGPSGGETFAIAVDPSNPSTVYAGTLTRLYKSIDAGDSWHDVSVGLPFDSAHTIVVDPTDSNVVYVAMELAGVFKSTNGGLAWSAMNNGLPGFGDPATWALAIDPETPTTLYVVANNDGHVYKSVDGAASWTIASNGLPADLMLTLAIDPATPSTVYVGTSSGGVYKTTDGGGNWGAVNNGLTDLTVIALAISPDNPSRIYAATLGGGVFRSNNGGQIWTDENNGLPGLGALFVAVDPTDASKVYAAAGGDLSRSNNSGNHWTSAGTGLPAVGTPRQIAIDTVTPTTIYVTTAEGVFKSTTTTPSWSNHSDGIPESDVTAVAVDPTTPTTVYAGSVEHGLSKSTDGTRTWSTANTGLGGAVAVAIAIDPATTTTLYVGTTTGVSKSTNAAASWNPAGTGLPVGSVFALAIDPATTSTLYAGTGTAGVYKSTNAAGAWSPANVGMGAVRVNAIAIDPATPTTLYAGTDSGVFKSVDGAANWSPASTGLSGDGLVVHDLAIDPSTPATIYAATDAGVVRSVDGAGNWGSPTTTAGGQAVAVEVDPVTTTTVYAALFYPAPVPPYLISVGTVEKSTTSGATWTTSNFSPYAFPTSLAIAPSAATHIYEGATDGGVLAYHDCGNGASEPLEECDDGNATAGDGCSATCTVEPCALSAFPLCGVVLQAQMQVSEKTPGKEKLKLQWKKIVGATTPASFGDPIGGSTRVSICLYDDAKTLVQGYAVDRAGDTCSGKPCWAAKGAKGLAYKDKLAASDGITAVSFKSGASKKGQASASGANNAGKGQTALPTGVFAALTANATPTIQLQTSDGFCVGATMTETTKNEGGVYKAKKK